MRISDWSSYVCSSDLQCFEQRDSDGAIVQARQIGEIGAARRAAGFAAPNREFFQRLETVGRKARRDERDAGNAAGRQRGERSVGGGFEQTGCASCRDRVCPYVSISVVVVYLKK